MHFEHFATPTAKTLRVLGTAITAALLTVASGCATRANPPGDVMPAFTRGARILFQGDSITDGHRSRNSDPSHELGHGYQYIIAAKFGAELAERNLTFINRGIGGNELSDLVGRWQTDTIDLEPDVLSILIGVNGLGDPEPADQFEREYDRLLTDTTDVLPHVRLVLCEPFGLPVGPRAADWAHYHAELLARVAAVDRLAERHHAIVVHFQRMFEQATTRAPGPYWIWDGIHPTYAGHQLMAAEWIRAVSKGSGNSASE